MTIQKGFVYRIVDGYVLYKFETEDLPTLNAGEDYKLRDDGHLIEVGAIYDPNTDTYTNPSHNPMYEEPIDVTPSKSLGIIYYNGTLKEIEVIIAVTLQITSVEAGVAQIIAKSNKSNPPTIIVGEAGLNGTLDLTQKQTLFFCAEPHNYYKVEKTISGSGVVTLDNWTEC